MIHDWLRIVYVWHAWKLRVTLECQADTIQNALIGWSVTQKWTPMCVLQCSNNISLADRAIYFCVATTTQADLRFPLRSACLDLQAFWDARIKYVYSTHSEYNAIGLLHNLFSLTYILLQINSRSHPIFHTDQCVFNDHFNAYERDIVSMAGRGGGV